MSALSIAGAGIGYVIMRGTDIVAGPISNRENAVAKLEALEREGRMKKRPCLRCRTEFLSEGAHNRMCNPCRSGTSSDAGDYNFTGRVTNKKLTN